MSGDTTSTGRLPGGASFAPGENVLVESRFMFSTAAFYLSTDLVLTNRRLYSVRPSTILGLIPVGTKRSNFPIENIAGVSAATRFNVAGLLIGVLALLIGIGTMALPRAEVLGLLLVILGISAIVNAPKQAIEVMNSGGGVILFPVSVFERRRTLEFAGDVAEAMARPGHRVSNAQAMPVAAPATVDARSALRNLEELRTEGLLTAEEYTAKRSEILARL